MPRKTHEQFINDFRERNPFSSTIKIVGEYIKANEKMECKCIIHDYTWFPRPNDLLSGQGCPICGENRRRKKRTKNNEDFVDELRIVNPSIKPLESYNGATKKIKVKCKLCNHEWYATPHNLLTGFGCPNCHHSSTSYMEQFLYKAFCMALGDEHVKSRNRELINAEIDILIPYLNIAFEIGSWRWHKELINRDAEKRLKCKALGITLVTIYDCCPIDEKPFEDNCYVFKHDLATERDDKTLKNLVMQLFEKCYIKTLFSDKEWSDISYFAYDNSKKMSTNEFVKRVAELNPYIEIIGDYFGSAKKTACKCRRCGHKWNPAPGSILAGTGCPVCAVEKRRGKRRKNDDCFRNEMSVLHPEIEVLGEYKGAFEKVKCKCRKCGYEWEGTPSNLLHKTKPHGCPICNDNKARRKRRKTNEQFLIELQERNPWIEPLEEYISQYDKVRCRCKKCGYEWDARPDKLIAKNKKNRRGCPNSKSHKIENH